MNAWPSLDISSRPRTLQTLARSHSSRVINVSGSVGPHDVTTAVPTKRPAHLALILVKCLSSINQATALQCLSTNSRCVGIFGTLRSMMRRMLPRNSSSWASVITCASG